MVAGRYTAATNDVEHQQPQTVSTRRRRRGSQTLSQTSPQTVSTYRRRRRHSQTSPQTPQTLSQTPQQTVVAFVASRPATTGRQQYKDARRVRNKYCVCFLNRSFNSPYCARPHIDMYEMSHPHARTLTCVKTMRRSKHANFASYLKINDFIYLFTRTLAIIDFNGCYGTDFIAFHYILKQLIV